MQEKSVRLTLSRKKGSKLESPNGLPIKSIARNTKYGNPFKIGNYYDKRLITNPTLTKEQYSKLTDKKEKDNYEKIDRNKAIELYKLSDFFFSGAKLQDLKHDLKGYNLACWCKPNEKCHGDMWCKPLAEKVKLIEYIEYLEGKLK